MRVCVSPDLRWPKPCNRSVTTGLVIVRPLPGGGRLPALLTRYFLHFVVYNEAPCVLPPHNKNLHPRVKDKYSRIHLFIKYSCVLSSVTSVSSPLTVLSSPLLLLTPGPRRTSSIEICPPLRSGKIRCPSLLSCPLFRRQLRHFSLLSLPPLGVVIEDRGPVSTFPSSPTPSSPLPLRQRLVAGQDR